MRLIDADKLLNKVENSMKNNPHKDIGIKRNHDTEHEHFINLICQSNTVYAPDKIIEQLLSESICARVDNDPFIMLDEAIRIVNNGGVNDLGHEWNID